MRPMTLSWSHSPKADALPPNLQAKIVEAYTSYLELVLRPDETLSPHERYAAALKAFEGFRVLTPHRRGPLGVEELNATIEVTLERALGDRLGFRVRDLHYRGRPILIRQNDYETGLFNGDIGLVVDRQRAVFPDAEVGIREILWPDTPPRNGLCHDGPQLPRLRIPGCLANLTGQDLANPDPRAALYRSDPRTRKGDHRRSPTGPARRTRGHRKACVWPPRSTLDVLKPRSLGP